MKHLKKTAVLNWEKWPFNLIYFPLYFVWLYYIIRSRAIWFFTPSNPAITFGGLMGETKKEMYAQLSPLLYPLTIRVKPTDSFELLVEKIKQVQINLPFVVKPEVGEAGILFRKIDELQQLKEYHQVVTEEYMVQAMVKFPVEVSVYYYRMPNSTKGIITGFLHKVPMHVVGDGYSTLHQLIHQHPKAPNYLADIKRIHAANLEKVIPAGEKYIFSHAANHRRGARFYNMQGEIDEALHMVFDGISNNVEGWYFGRYDVMCQSIAELKEGRNFSILEYNGCGAEPNHIYDSGYSLSGAYKEIMKHWAALYSISRYNVKQGIRPWPVWKGLRYLLVASKQLKYIKRLDQKLSF